MVVVVVGGLWRGYVVRVAWCVVPAAWCVVRHASCGVHVAVVVCGLWCVVCQCETFLRFSFVIVAVMALRGFAVDDAAWSQCPPFPTLG